MRASSSSGGGGSASGPERGHELVLVELARREELRPGALLGAELAQAKLAAVAEPDQEPRAAIAQRGALVIELEPPGGHQVNQHHELARVDCQHLAHAADAGELDPGEGVERRVERLHGHHARGERGLHLRAAHALGQAAGGDLDLG